MSTTALRPSDIQPTGVRLPPDLRDELMRQATKNRRSLSQEIIQRLLATMDAVAPRTGAAPAAVREAVPAYGESLNDTQRQLLAAFATLPPDKQLALLTLLRR